MFDQQGSNQQLWEDPMGKAFLRRALPAIAAGVLTISSFSTAHAFDPQAKWCSGVKIAAFPGGPQGGVFANNVYNGFRQAELDLGSDGHLLLLGLGSEQDADPDPAGGRNQGRRHRHLRLRRRGRHRSGGRPGLRAGHHLHHAQHLAARQPGELFAPQGFGYVGAPNYAAGFALATEAAKRAEPEDGRQGLRLGPQGPGRRPRPAHRRRHRRLHRRSAPT